MRIDSHQHFWVYSQPEYPWIPRTSTQQTRSGLDESNLDQDFLPHDLLPLLRDARLDGCIAVQARQTLQENDFLLSLASQNDFILGVVGWIDLRSGDANAQAQQFASHPKAVGVRHVVQDEVEQMFMAGEAFRRGIACLKRYQLTYDVLVYEHQLADAVALAKAFPDQQFVLDHIGKPKIRVGSITEWRSQLHQLAALSNVAVKVSGMLTEADHRSWKAEQLTAYWDVVLNAFGPTRILFGSDWPVLRLASTYERWTALVDQWLSQLSATERAAIWGLNAHRIYLADTQFFVELDTCAQ